jgi:nicotinamide mononucleotide transporter
MDFINTFTKNLYATSFIEWAGVVTSIVYVILAAYSNIFCWIFGFISSAIYVYLAFEGKLFIDSALQLFYVVMSVYGWITWNKISGKGSKIVMRPAWFHVKVLVVGSVGAFLIGFIFDNYTLQESPYLDASIASFSLIATFMSAHRVLENWIYWIVVDAFAIVLFASRDYAMTAVLYFIFTIMAIYGLWKWTVIYKKQNGSGNDNFLHNKISHA